MMHTATEKEAYDTALLPIWQPVRAHSSSAMKVWYPRGYRGYRIAWMKETFSWDIYENKKTIENRINFQSRTRSKSRSIHIFTPGSTGADFETDQLDSSNRLIDDIMAIIYRIWNETSNGGNIFAVKDHLDESDRTESNASSSGKRPSQRTSGVKSRCCLS